MEVLYEILRHIRLPLGNFGHSNILHFCNRPFKDANAMNVGLIRNWNERVTPEDTVFHVGDFCFRTDRATADKLGVGKEKSNHWYKQLNGNIIFIKGNHDCLEEHTEFLTINGWKTIHNYSGEAIANFDINTNEIYFDVPSNVIPLHEQECISIEGNLSKQIVSINHDVVVNQNKIKACELLNKKLYTNDFIQSGIHKNKGINITDFYLKLVLWTIFDGCLVISSKNKKRLQFKLSKKRKIDNLKTLLDSNNCKYTFRKASKSKLNILQPYYITIYGKTAIEIANILNDKKEFPSWFNNMNIEQAEVLFDVMKNTDAYETKHYINLSSTNEHNINVIQEIMVRNNYTSKINVSDNASGFKNGKRQYSIKIWKRQYKQNLPIEIKEVGIKRVFCFTMPRHTLITRIDGKVAFTGNCNNSLKTCIDSVYVTFAGKSIKLVHKPEHADPNVDINLVGHVHDKWRIRTFEEHYGCIATIVSNGSNREDLKRFLIKQAVNCHKQSVLLNVGVDVQKYYPITLDEAICQVNQFKKEMNN